MKEGQPDRLQARERVVSLGKHVKGLGLMDGRFGDRTSPMPQTLSCSRVVLAAAWKPEEMCERLSWKDTVVVPGQLARRLCMR